MIFIRLGKLREKATNKGAAEVTKIMKELAKEGVKVLSYYYTLGRYDTVVIIEAPDEKAAMKAGIMLGGIVASETLVAVPREEGMKLIE